MNGKLLINQADSNFNNYGKVSYSDRYHSSSKQTRASLNRHKNYSNVTKPENNSKSRKIEINNKYKPIIALGLTRRKKKS